MTTDAIHPGSDGPVEYPFLSQAIRAGDFVFVSGNTGLLPGTGESGEGFHWMPGTLIEGGIEAETRQALANIDAILRAIPSSATLIVTSTRTTASTPRSSLCGHRLARLFSRRSTGHSSWRSRALHTCL